eukprot:746386-Hanusia_phi.AAC.1
MSAVERKEDGRRGFLYCGAREVLRTRDAHVRRGGRQVETGGIVEEGTYTRVVKRGGGYWEDEEEDEKR